MASRPSVEHVLPLCTASASFALSLFQFPAFGGFLTARPSIAGQPLSAYWDAVLLPELAIIIPPLLVSGASGLLASRSLSAEAASYYRYGAISALGHLAFVGLVAPRIRAMVRRKVSDRDKDARSSEADEQANRKQQRQWLTIHLFRTLTVDLAAVIFFYRGLMAAFA